MTEEEYKQKRRRLEVDAKDARKALNRARTVCEGICEELRSLRIEWREQQKAG